MSIIKSQKSKFVLVKQTSPYVKKLQRYLPDFLLSVTHIAVTVYTYIRVFYLTVSSAPLGTSNRVLSSQLLLLAFLPSANK